jgi:hypothetical protein
MGRISSSFRRAFTDCRAGLSSAGEVRAVRERGSAGGGETRPSGGAVNHRVFCEGGGGDAVSFLFVVVRR